MTMKSGPNSSDRKKIMRMIAEGKEPAAISTVLQIKLPSILMYTTDGKKAVEISRKKIAADAKKKAKAEAVETAKAEGKAEAETEEEKDMLAQVKAEAKQKAKAA